MQEQSCKRCGQSPRTDRELEEHTERVHGGGKMAGEPEAGSEPKTSRR